MKTWIYDLPRIGPYLRKRHYRLIFSSLRPGDIGIDCGANIGKNTERMAKNGATIYAFEPDPTAYAELVKRMEPYKHRVFCYNAAVSDHNGEATLYFHINAKQDPVKWSVGSSLIKEKGNVNPDHSTKVPLVDFGRFIQSLESRVSLVKMDIEGAEVEVLNQILDLGLYKKIGNIVAETHERIPILKEPIAKLRKRIRELGVRNIDTEWD